MWHRLIYRLIYRLKCRFWHKYNRVICDLPPTWCDRDHFLLFASFKILEDFVEKEEGHFYDDVYKLYLEDGDEEYAWQMEMEWDEIRMLYYWWKERKQDDDFWLENYEVDNRMLHRLISLRHNLWT